MIFVGPTPETIRTMGDKAAARERRRAAGVPHRARVSEGGSTTSTRRSSARPRSAIPVMIKAAAGGGGRGIRIAETPDELRSSIPTGAAEARAAFGDGGLYLESFVARARHIEVQVLGDGERRDPSASSANVRCSAGARKSGRRRRSPASTPAVREALCASAVRLARASAIAAPARSNISTTKRRGEFFFIEMNTRIQVEHPVTEMITGIDLVREMMRIARGRAAAPAARPTSRSRGHAIEVRINAEDPAEELHARRPAR